MRALLARIPGIAWVIALGAVLLVGATCAIYATGRRAGAAAAHRTALADSARVAHAAVDTATRRTDAAVSQARTAAAMSATAREQWELQREAAREALERSPAPVVALVESARATMAQQDTTIHVQQRALDAYAAERAARVRADTIESHEIDLVGGEEAGPAWHDVAITAAIAAGASWVFWHLAR